MTATAIATLKNRFLEYDPKEWTDDMLDSIVSPQDTFSPEGSPAIRIGTLSSSTQTGFSLAAATNSVIDSFADDNNTTLANAVYTNIRGRTMLFKDCTGISLFSVRGQIKCADEVDFASGVYAAVQGYFETMDDTDIQSGAKFWGVDSSIESPASGTVTVDSGGILGGLHAELTGGGEFIQSSGGILAGLYVDEQVTTGAWGYGAYITGANVGILVNANLTPDANRTYMSVQLAGSRATEKDVTYAAATNQNLDVMQYNLNLIGSNPSNSSTTNVIYGNVTHDTTNMANLRVKGCDWTLGVSKNLQDAYTIQTELDIDTNSVTVGGEACAIGSTTSVTSAVTGNVWNTVMVFSTDQTMSSAATLFLSHRSTGTIGHAIYIEANSGTTLGDCIYINSAGTVNYLLAFSAAAGPIATDTSNLPAAATHKIKCRVAGTDFYLIGVADF